jgi:osmotically inducible protein OsmC
MKIVRKASAVWSGGLKDGKGAISTESGALTGKVYGFAMRFGDEKGTNPEELIGAAHAGCFTMALSKILGDAGYVATQMDTEAKVTMEEKDGGFAITAIRLTIQAKIPNIDEAKFTELADAAKVGCPISKLLNTEIALDAKLVI